MTFTIPIELIVVIVSAAFGMLTFNGHLLLLINRKLSEIRLDYALMNKDVRGLKRKAGIEDEG